MGVLGKTTPSCQEAAPYSRAVCLKGRRPQLLAGERLRFTTRRIRVTALGATQRRCRLFSHSLSILCHPNDLCSLILEAHRLDPLALLGTEDLQARRSRHRMLLPPRMLLPHLGTGPRLPITPGLLQPPPEAGLRQRLGARRQFPPDLPQHPRGAALVRVAAGAAHPSSTPTPLAPTATGTPAANPRLPAPPSRSSHSPEIYP